MQGRGTGRAMGLDVGERRVGVAISDELDMISSPLMIVQRRDGDLAELRDLAIAKGVDRLVVGLPTGLSGREGPQAAVVRQFADALGAAVGPEVRVVFWDERLTTAVAERTLQQSGSWRRRRKGDVDAVAAAVILQGYLDACRARVLRGQKQDNADAR
jgi:putative holliday junction resolvase